MSLSNELPAPGSLINIAGALDVSGEPAPGFSGVNLRSNERVDVLRSRSNRGLPISDGSHYWSFSIEYHPMRKTLFNSLESFLLGHGTKRNPFFVVLPNYSGPQQANFTSFIDSNAIELPAGSAFAGDTTLLIESGIALPTDTHALPGDLFNIVDPSDALHKNIYKVTRIETATAFSTTAPAAGKQRLHIYPPLQRDIIGLSTLEFSRPKFRVIQSSDYQVEFDENNLISFNFEVEELMP